MAALLATMTGCGVSAPPSTPSLATPASVTPTETSPLATPSVSPTTSTEATFFSVPTSSLSAISVFDWNGQLVGQGTASVPLECCTVEQSPDGSRLEVATATGSVVLGRFGRPVQSLPPSLSGGTWAEDDVHQCLAQEDSPSSTEGELYLVGPGDQSKKVATISGFGPHTATGVVACDVGENLALLATSFMGSPESLTEIRLSDGAILWQRKAGASSGACSVPQVISPGATYGASSDDQGGTICDLATSTVVAELQGEPLAVSWDGHVVIARILSPSNGYSLEAIDWQTGAVIWSGPPPPSTLPGLVPTVNTEDQPNGDAIALTTVPEPGADYSEDLAELWLIRPGYPAQELSDDAEPGVL